LVHGGNHLGDHDGGGDATGGRKRVYRKRPIAGCSDQYDFQGGFYILDRLHLMLGPAHGFSRNGTLPAPSIDVTQPLNSALWNPRRNISFFVEFFKPSFAVLNYRGIG
jgi:hypothetical protein